MPWRLQSASCMSREVCEFVERGLASEAAVSRADGKASELSGYALCVFDEKSEVAT
jgi:hypothetical protein